MNSDTVKVTGRKAQRLEGMFGEKPDPAPAGHLAESETTNALPHIDVAGSF